jgi:type I restriction enzyme S subunit
MKENRNKIANVPNLRFGEFEGEWEKKTLGEIIENIKERISTSSLSVDNYISTENILQNFQGVVSATSIPYDTNVVSFKQGDVLFSNIRPYLKKIWLASNDGGCSSDVFVFRNNDICLSQFLYHSIANDKFINYVMLGTKGTKMPRGDKQQINQYSVYLPSKPEQEKITNLLFLLDFRILTQIQIIEELKSLKKALRNNLYKQITKIGKVEQIANLLNYEQPTNYIVENTNYSDNGSLTPVLTANKAFVLGYTDENFGIYNKGECIIFDDFTMDLKYVYFPFKVKSSAIKILTAKQNVNLRFIYEYLSFLKLTSTDHKRHYISEIEPMCISLPKNEFQNKTANILSTIDEKINLETKQYDLFLKQKKYLLANMFI